MTLFWHPTGPLVRFDDGMLRIHDLNPEVETRWRMSRVEMMKLGFRCFWAALRG